MHTTEEPTFPPYTAPRAGRPTPAPAPAYVPAPEISLGALWRPFVRRWRFVAGAVFVAWLLVAATLLLPRRYSASMALAAVPNARSSSISGGLSALLAAGQVGGIQSTPRFVAAFLQMRGVLLSVAKMPALPGRSESLVEHILEKPRAEIQAKEVEPAMREAIGVEVEKATGIVTLSVTLEDSAVARRMAGALADAAQRQYVTVTRAQASQQRAAMAARVDSAARQLRNAEERLAGFIAGNRGYSSFASANVEKARVERELTNATSVYNQAVQDREQAVARELEETPALVVVDDVPAEMVPVPRRIVLKLLFVTVLAIAGAAALLFVRGELPEPARR